jgi:hypothetical protein
LSFEGSHTPAGQEPAESRHGVAVVTTSPYVYKQLHIPQVEREQAIRRSISSTQWLIKAVGHCILRSLMRER